MLNCAYNITVVYTTDYTTTEFQLEYGFIEYFNPKILKILWKRKL